ncbi:hypothetical protein F383_04880 [Gossypium arboreum]|uniref:Uncharacterized protein n=1 Tax=Gossypium arboreum TaxID=29729 RepID=A0A0B0PHW8_GOSAR|nr:hypothetical protein F383_04880 [Gossypium arboreum]
MGDNMEPLVERTRLARTISHAQDELKSFRTYLRWMCVDQSNIWMGCLSWFMFIVFGLLVPLVSHFMLACSTCDATHTRPYDWVVQLSLSSVSALSFVCLTRFVKKHGLRRFLFLDKLCDESETVRKQYTVQLNRSLKIVSFFVLPCFIAETAYKVWWYASGASQIPFLGIVWLSDTVACVMELCSWLYRTTVFFLVCVLFRLICNLQVLRLHDFAKVFNVDSDVGSVLREHLRIRRQLRIISHRYRAFIVWCLILVTFSQFTSLLITTKSNSRLNIYKAGELAVKEDELDNCKLIPAYAYSTISYHKRQALVTYFEKNQGGITVYGIALDRSTLHTIFGIELSFVLWILGKTIGIS